MIASIVSAAKSIVKRPQVLVPGLVAVGIVFGLIYLFAGFVIELLVNAFFLEIIPEAPLEALPFQFGAIYGTELLGLLVLAFLSGVLFTSLNYWFAAYVRETGREKPSFGKTCSETVSKLGEIVAFVIFIALIAAVFAVLFWLFGVVALAVPVLGAVLLLLLCLAAFYLYVKLAFVVSAMGLEKANVKQAFEKSWKFAEKRFWQVLLFLIVVTLINQVILFAGSTLSEMFLDEYVEIGVLAVFWAVSLTFLGMAIPIYYAKNKLGKSI